MLYSKVVVGALDKVPLPRVPSAFFTASAYSGRLLLGAGIRAICSFSEDSRSPSPSESGGHLAREFRGFGPE